MNEDTIYINYELTREEFEDELVGRKLSDSEWNIVRGTITEALGEAYSTILFAEAEVVGYGGYE
jgi:hypothetical protein